MEIDNDTPQVKREDLYSDDKYKVVSFSTDSHNLRRITCESESICILPFDKNDQGKIKNVYLLKYHDYMSNKFGNICINFDINPNVDSSYFDAVSRGVDSYLGIKVDDINSLFYLGTIEHTLPFSKTFRCYALDLTNYIKDPSGFTPNISTNVSKLFSIDKININKLLNGEIKDSLSLSCSALLLTSLS